MSKRLKLGAQDGLHGIFHHLDALQKWKNDENFPPLWVEVSPTASCNQNCFYCYAEYLREDRYIPKDLLIKVMRDMGTYGVKCCEFQGTGEPLLNKGVSDAIVAGKKAGMDMCLVTNGSLLTKEMLEKIEPSLSFLRVSALAHNAEFYTKLHRCPEEHFHSVINGLEEAARIRDRENLDTVIVATFIVFDFNTPHVADTARLLKDVGVDLMSVKPSVVMEHNEGHNWERDSFHHKYKEEFDEAKALEDDDFKVFLNEKYLDSFMSGWRPPRNYTKCHGVEFETHIDANAKLYPCAFCWRDEEYCLGNLREKSFEEIWSGQKRRNVLNRFYENIDVDNCENFCCKQHSINGMLHEMANPPRHKSVI